MIAERLPAAVIRQFLEKTMEPMRTARMKQFRKTTHVLTGWKLTNSTGKKGVADSITQLTIPVGSSVYVGDPDGYANQSYLYRQFRTNQAVVARNTLTRRPSADELHSIRKANAPIDLSKEFLQQNDIACTLSIHDPDFEYRVGETVVPRGRDFSFDEGYYAPGIHFFLDIYDAYTFT